MSDSKSRAVVNVHFSSKTDMWATPPDLFAKLDAEFGFMIDVCATTDNTKCANYFTPQVDGLKQDWRGVCWMNPPYGRQIKKWIQKAYISSLQGATVVCLIPSRTDTYWWHTYVRRAHEIRFIRGLLKFGGSKNSAPFPSVITVFRPPDSDARPDQTRGTGSTLFGGYADH